MSPKRTRRTTLRLGLSLAAGAGAAEANQSTPAAAPASPEQELNAKLEQMIFGFRLTQMLYVAARLNLAKLLESGPLPVADLALGAGAHADTLYRLMRTLSGFGIFAEEAGMRFRLTPLASLLRPNAPGSLHAAAIVMGEDFNWRSWGGLLHSVQTGETAFDHLFGENTFDWFRKHPEPARLFDNFQAELTRRSASAVAGSYDFSAAKVVVDVGGGAGELLAAVLKNAPQAKGILFDLADVTETAQRGAQSPLRERATFTGGDFFREVPAGGDVYLLKYIIHDWDDERAVTILRNCHRAMKPTTKLLVVEDLICGPNESCRAKAGDIVMLVRTGGRNRTEAEYRLLLEKAGFKISRVVPTPSGLAIIEATP